MKIKSVIVSPLGSFYSQPELYPQTQLPLLFRKVVPGCYIIYSQESPDHEDDICLYVGRSERNIFARILEHIQLHNNKGTPSKEIRQLAQQYKGRIEFYSTDNPYYLEIVLIALFRPTLNENGKMSGKEELREILLCLESMSKTYLPNIKSLELKRYSKLIFDVLEETS